MPKGTATPTKKLTIALLMDWFSNQYLLDIWTSVTQAAQARNVNVITIVGGRLKWFDSTEAASNIMYQLANANMVDGILMTSSSLFSLLSIEERLEFVEQFQSLPVVLMGEQVADYPSVIIDNTSGLHDIITHLVVRHGCKRLAFIGGPQNNWEASQRLAVFKAVLEEHQLPLDEKLIFHGDFLNRSGVQAIEVFYAQGLMPCDAIVAANDYMAIGALKALQARQVLVPDQVLLTGFDNLEDSHLSVPTLTTVNQPIRAMANKAFDLLLEHITNRDTVTRKIILPTKGIIRQSCGCYSITNTSLQADFGQRVGKTAVSGTLEENLQQQKSRLLAEIEVSFNENLFGRYNSAWAEHLYSAWLQSWQADDPGILLGALENISQRMIRRELNIQVLADAAHVLFQFSRSVTTDDEILTRLDDRQLQVRLAIDTLVQRGDLKYRFNVFMRDLRVRLFGERLLSQKDLHGAFEEMSQSLPNLGISRFYLVLYDQQRATGKFHELPQWSYLAFAHDENGSVTPDFREQRFLTADLLPGYLQFKGQFTKILFFPLYSNRQQFGYLVIDIDADDSRYHYDLIRDHVSLTLESLLPKLELIANRDQLETEVTNKAYELALANEQLKAYTAELERRNWELQQFAHVAQNELLEPLHNIRRLGDRLETQYAPLLTDRGGFYVNRMQHAIARMQALIDDLLIFTQVTNQQTTSFHEVDLNQVVSNVVGRLEAEILAVNGRIQVEALPVIEANASQMYQLFYNLIHNALKFHRQGVPPVIAIKSQPLSTDEAESQMLWEITVADNGVGFDEKYSERIFTLFQRIHSRQEVSETGIGLAVCRRVVELHNGTIAARSQSSKGTTFIITLPGRQN